jgi:uncharacterized protein
MQKRTEQSSQGDGVIANRYFSPKQIEFKINILVIKITKSNRYLLIVDVKQPEFIVDCMGGNIAKKLRIMGFDTEFWLDVSDDFLIDKSNYEQKLLITRDKGLYLRISKSSKNGLLLPDQDEVKNLVFILESCNIKHINPVPNVNTRCTVCNGALKKLDKTMASNPIPEKIYKNIAKIYECSKCSKVYWEGTHIENMNKLINNINELLGK